MLGNAIFQYVNQENNYTRNYNIDKVAFGSNNKSDIGRGWDSTVWQKVFTEGTEKYVMVAELNSVIPTFDISVDAPTMYPIAPHFDTSSTNVYYQLHAQPQWGLRVAQDNSDKSDGKTTWVKEVYDPVTGETTTLWFNGTEWTSTETQNGVNAAIYFNKQAFDPQVEREEGAPIKGKDLVFLEKI